MRSRIDLAGKVDNSYWPVMIVTGKRKRPALFTSAQISEAMDRAEDNPEDMQKPGVWERIRQWLTAR